MGGIILGTMAGCTDPCDDTNCQNGATCDDGTCICADWYEGDQCETETRKKFYGIYTGVYTQNGQTTNGSVELVEFTDNVQRIRLAGSNNYFVLSGSNAFDVPLQQVVTNQGTYTMEGSGSLNGNQLTFNVTQTFNGQTAILNFTGTK